MCLDFKYNFTRYFLLYFKFAVLTKGYAMYKTIFDSS